MPVWPPFRNGPGWGYMASWTHVNLLGLEVAPDLYPAMAMPMLIVPDRARPRHNRRGLGLDHGQGGRQPALSSFHRITFELTIRYVIKSCGHFGAICGKFDEVATLDVPADEAAPSLVPTTTMMPTPLLLQHSVGHRDISPGPPELFGMVTRVCDNACGGVSECQFVVHCGGKSASRQYINCHGARAR